MTGKAEEGLDTREKEDVTGGLRKSECWTRRLNKRVGCRGRHGGLGKSGEEGRGQRGAGEGIRDVKGDGEAREGLRASVICAGSRRVRGEAGGGEQGEEGQTEVLVMPLGA